MCAFLLLASPPAGSKPIEHAQPPYDFTIQPYTRIFRFRNCLQHCTRMIRGHLFGLADILLSHETL